MEWLRVALVSVVLASCATAASDDDDKVVPPDAASSVFPDARPRSDAAPIPDAAPIVFDATPLPPDAAQGLFCENSNVCDGDECCLTLGGDTGVCVRGEEILGVCLPD